MKKIFLFVSLITSGIAIGQTIGPSTLNACGGFSNNIVGNTFEWSVGEMTAVHTASSANIIVTHGILQPKKKSTNDIDEVFFSENQISVYPNPTEGLVFIRLHLSAGTQLSYTLVDMKGKTILQENTDLLQGDDIVSIDLEGYPRGSYTLNIKAKTSLKNYFETFKIVKK